MTRLQRHAVLTLALIVAGCTVQGRAYQPEPVPSSLSVIHLYRPYHFYGSATVPLVTCANGSIYLQPAGYHSYVAQSGPITCRASTEATTVLKFDAKPGQEYFVKEEIAPGNVIGRAQFTLVDPEVAHTEIAQCHNQTIPDPSVSP